MSSKGAIFKACQCPDDQARRRQRRDCPRLAERSHGSWHFDCRVKDLWGRSLQVRRQGFPTRVAAEKARDNLQAQTREQFAGHSWTVGRWLRHWLNTRTSLRPTTLHGYTHHVEAHLVPRLGNARLSELSTRHLKAFFADLAKNTNRLGDPLSASTLSRIRATLRAALNAAIREGLITDNPARRVELPGGSRPHAVAWTDQRVAAWRHTGKHDPVCVWTPGQLAVFLDRVAADRLYALWWLYALRGLRRGEAAGLRWHNVDLTRGQIHITEQRVAVGYRVHTGVPKSRASRRTVALDPHTVQVLREHQRRQQAEQRAAGHRWHDTGYVFTRADGRPLHPSYVTQRFRTLHQRAGLPPVRLHDLRHGAASLAHEAGADLKTVQDQLGHASIVLTADTYTTVLPRAQFRAAAATAALVLSAARRTRQAMKQRRPGDGAEPSLPVAHPDRKAQVSSPAATGPQPRRPRRKSRKGKRQSSNKNPHGTKHGRKTAGQGVGRQGLEP